MRTNPEEWNSPYFQKVRMTYSLWAFGNNFPYFLFFNLFSSNLCRSLCKCANPFSFLAPLRTVHFNFLCTFFLFSKGGMILMSLLVVVVPRDLFLILLHLCFSFGSSCGFIGIPLSITSAIRPFCFLIWILHLIGCTQSFLAHSSPPLQI